MVVVDESDTPFIWFDKETAKVSFGGANFRLYKEQRQLCMGLRLLSKASGWTSDPVLIEVQRRGYSSNKRISEYEFKVEEVQQRIPLVLGEREIEVLHRLINGNGMRAIGKHMKLFSTTIFKVRNNVLNQIMK
ncbi:hypothetical protein [Lysinibacillus xylanilyticus]|uniref:hypothetical protein n=1 Tax=Lysinibacillus xylanilyticus TaxID=582475 RepID=UPI003D09300B